MITKNSILLISAVATQGCSVLCPQCSQVQHLLIGQSFGCNAAAAYEIGSIAPVAYLDDCADPGRNLDIPNLISDGWIATGMHDQTGYLLFDPVLINPYLIELSKQEGDEQ